MSNDTSEPPRKRLRVNRHDSPATGPQTTPSFDHLTRDAEFWLDDGNIVLIARDTAFKIYRGLLAAQSPVFQDMFAMVQPQAAREWEECPVVHLSDSVEDLRHFLRALLPKAQRRCVRSNACNTSSNPIMSS